MHEKSVDADNWDSHWEELSQSLYAHTPGVKYRWEGIDRLLDLDHTSLKSVRLLDIGCGTGDMLQYLASIYPDVQAKGVDNSSFGLALARKKLPQSEFLQIDLCNTEKSEGTSLEGWATHSLCSEVLEHLDDPVSFLRKISRFLRKGASLVISVPGGPMSFLDHQVGHRKHYKPEVLRKELEQAGYKVDRVVAAGFPFYNLYRLALIFKGKSVIESQKQEQRPTFLFSVIMACFSFLFKFNLFNSRIGWLVYAKATWVGDRGKEI